MNWEFSFSIICSALFGAIITCMIQRIRDWAASRNPLRIEAMRSSAPPLWFAINSTREEIGDDREFQKQAFQKGIFCGFAKLNVKLTNTSRSYLYITDIHVTKQPKDIASVTRVRFIPQGGSTAIRLNCNLDDPYPFFVHDLSQWYNRGRGVFQRGFQICIAPGETELVFLGFVSLRETWQFNCRLKFEINGEERLSEPIFTSDCVITPYIPENFKHDYCGLIRNTPFEFLDIRQDDEFFDSSMRNSNAHLTRKPSSSLEYLQKELDPH